MKTLFISFLISLFLIACTKQEYESFREYPDVSNITRVNLSPSSPVLVANGKAELKFKVKAYMDVEDTRKVEVNVNDEIVVKDSTFRSSIEINSKRIPKEWIKIYLEDGTPVDSIFTTTDYERGAFVFKASVNGVESKPRTVQVIKEPEVDFEPIIIPIIFHLVYTGSETYQYDEITTEVLQEILDRVNKVYQNQITPNAPVSENVNVTFELATHDKSGKLLKEKGINRVKVRDDENVTTYIKNNLIWNLDKFLNIWVGNKVTDEYSVEVEYPSYILDNGSELQGQSLRKVKNPSEAKYSNYTSVGIGLNKVHIYRMKLANSSGSSGGTGPRLETILGSFYGLYDTWYYTWGGAKTDYCSDTYTYFKMYTRIEKWTYRDGIKDQDEIDGNEIYFDSMNIMDEHSHSSVITYEQALRVRTVMENCPFRMMKK